MTPSTPEPMRVAILMRPATGGMRRHLETLLRLRNRERILPVLFAPDDFASLANELEVPFVPFNFSSRPAPIIDNRSVRKLVRLVEGQFDVFHAHGVRGLWLGASVADQAHIPVVFTAHNLLPPLPLIPRFALSSMIKRVGQMISVSQAIATTYVDNGLSVKQLDIIPNGVNLARFTKPEEGAEIRKRYLIEENAPLIVAVGRLATEKGFDLLISAFRHLRLQMPQAHCMIVGGGEEEENLRQYGWGEANLHFVGAVEEPAPYFHAANVIAIPSRMEGQGIVALEAMAARKPVVATRIGGLVETIEEQVTGTLVPPHDPFSLSNALSVLLSSPPLGLAMGVAGRRRVESRYTAEQMVSRTENLYANILRQSKEH